jgi:hypothetical protein
MRSRRLLTNRENAAQCAVSRSPRVVGIAWLPIARIEGSHHILTHARFFELLNLQDVKGEAKPYQVRQLLQLVERYNLRQGADE